MLNPQQNQVVKTTEGALMVLAGAGSGKTKSIIHRVAYLIQDQKVAPWNILVVTFTNKAARELQHRLEELLRFPVSALWVGTFHSICIRILRYESAHLPFNSNFSIYDEDDKKSVLKKIYKANNIDVQKMPIQRVMNNISKHKNQLSLPEDLISQVDENTGYHHSHKSGTSEQGDFFTSFLPIYQKYQQTLLLNQALDFDDILLYTAKLLQSNEAVRKKYQNQFKYTMIDEYQDTNYAQFQIVYQIAKDSKNICVVGDDDQAIYSWRGASIRNILEFERDYGSVTAIRLEQNYRSTNNILHLANAIIKNNKRRHPKELWSELGDGEKPLLLDYDNETQEAEKTADRILSLQQSGIPLNNIAVLYRTNAQSRVFEYTFMQKKLPYSIVGSLYFYQRKEIKDLLAYLWVIANPSDNESLLRSINEPPRGIGQTTINKLITYANKLHITLYQALENAEDIPDIQRGTKTKLTDFHQKVKGWRSLSLNSPVLDVVKTVLEELNWIELYRQSKDPKDIARSENLIEFVTAVSEFTERFMREQEHFPRLTDYLPFISLQTDLDQLSDQNETVRLMTMHNAKGLEFEVVFIVGLEDELLPHRMSKESREDIEEERRLFYVAVTRARSQLFLSYAKFRRLYDTFYYTKPSIFISEIDPNLIQTPSSSPFIPMAPRARSKTKVQSRESKKHYRIGQKVYHEEYGIGMILNVDGEDETARLSISFGKGKLVKIIGTFIKTEF